MNLAETPTKSGFNRNAIIFLFDIVIFFILLNVLPFDAKANKGLALLVFIAVLWLTEALHVTVTALLVPLLAIGLGLVATKNALAAFADPTIFLFFGGFALATALHIQKLDRMIANKIMALARGKLFVTSIYLFSITAFLSMWMSNTATAAMMLPLAMGVLSQMDREANHNTYVFILLGIAYSANIGGMGTLVGSPPNAIVASQLKLTFSDWLQYGLPIMLILMPLMIGTLYLVFKPKLNVRFEKHFEVIEMNKSRIITLCIFVTIALCWVFSSQINPLLSNLLGLEKKMASFDSVVALLAAVVICSTGVATWKQIQDNTDWGVLMLFGGGLTLSAVLRDSGASKILADGIVFLIEGGHFYLIGLLVAAFIIFLTEFTSNTASAALLVPIFISIAQSLGMPELGLALIIGLGASCAFMLPVATPPNAIVFGTGEIRQSEMVRVGVLLNIVCIFVIATVGYLFWL
ncbi:DASS family sodium-coupled anion symporter [Pasteurella multocida subsp. multocida]|uniref:DASS family sodium-coupled anion symporter n=1 Tax=Pasteurella multocida TaxID=747 RepID=A0A9X3ZL78_PASMD|nr:DASS family sodium-coupled anion symporter [Pasteurella multocida]MBF6980423.1 DASS family sodium-coupled anion symporter [Pasteurella multocida]MDA5610640.1 DASS family sodium-coupled anion symporter [Pasteurella multocida]MDA5612924.1 DASS family sodium-coupled anion symporter [Pasteurella multocida]MDA5617894.1 DASS family sodium-coupled anion symporter [Pasteurella multocida subsp. multocida]MDA5620428.1 DASS family sodium-coupled anion symporter [Pasteurella multocida subsp. multocida]